MPTQFPKPNAPQPETRRLPPTTPELLDDASRPYFLWWTDLSVGQLRERLRSHDPAERAYWLGALLREANTRDVWLFVSPQEIRDSWPRLIRHLGRSREMWTWLLRMPEIHWPPSDAVVDVEGVAVESLADLRASKLTCVLSRSEPRDLVDLYFLDRAGFPAEADLELALAKDAGIDPGVLAWLLREFPTEPLPQMLEELSPSELRRFRDELAARLRDLAIGSEQEPTGDG